MKIAIIGTRGIPNYYGGFEQFAEYLSLGLVQLGHEVFVYNSHNHFYKEKVWKSVNIIHKFDPEYLIGTAGQFIYDLNCILDSRKRKFDLILQLGYTSSSVWSFLFPKKSVIVTNMDGLEWKRTKYGKYTQKFLKYAEKLAINHSDYLVADSIGIRSYIEETYKVESEYIPYGASIFNDPNPKVIEKYKLLPYQYDLLIARLEPENSIDLILDGFHASASKRNFIVVGNFKTAYGDYLTNKFKSNSKIIFLGPNYDISEVNNLRYYSNIYFHGHTVGGTNPSLLEAMASSSLLVANRNQFNEAILGEDAYYFNTSEEVRHILNTVSKNQTEKLKIDSNINKIKLLYSWEKIINDYANFMTKAVLNSGKS